jgi:hypothetical protein
MATGIGSGAPDDEPYEIVFSMFVPKGTMYLINRNEFEPGRGVALVFSDNEDYLLWKSDPDRWRRPGPVAPAPGVV